MEFALGNLQAKAGWMLIMSEKGNILRFERSSNTDGKGSGQWSFLKAVLWRANGVQRLNLRARCMKWVFRAQTVSAAANVKRSAPPRLYIIALHLGC